MKIAVILYKSNILANSEYPLMVRITKKISKHVSLGLSCLVSLWDLQKSQPRKNHPSKKLLEAMIAQKIASYHSKLLEITENKTVSLEALIIGKDGRIIIHTNLDFAEQHNNEHEVEWLSRVSAKYGHEA